jgi:cobalamin biosynthesis protein CobC
LLSSAGFTVLGGTRLFRLAEHPDATVCFRHMLAAGILTRPFADARDQLRFGIPADETQWRRLAAALRASP